MTKDVELHSSTWKTMKQAITGITENATVSSSGYGNYTNAQAGSYSTGTASTGFAKRVEDLVKISEKVQKLIKEKDTDGVVSYTYHDETSTAQILQAKLSTLERYAENVNTYIKKNIDRPFYEAMDKVGAKLEALNIQKYKTTNKIGYKRIESVKDPYGHPVGTKEVTPSEIGIDELYKVDSPYKASLKKSYEKYKKSKDYKDHRLTETEYVQVMHQTRSFEYVSIDDEKSTTEMWRDLTLSAATVVLYVFCPPAGAVLSTVVAAADMYSAASGKDWGTGRELDGNERAMRGAFALLDLIPAGKYLSGLAKTGKTAGLTAVKTSIKTAVKEGVEQGAKNFDTFKGLLKKTKGLGDNIFSQIKTYGKQLDNLRPSKILSNSADDLSDAAQRFSLNSLEQLQPVTGSIPFEGGKLTHQADNLSAFAKNLDGSVDDVVESLSRSTLADNINVVQTVQADEVNTWWKTEMGYDNPPYKPGTSVDIISLKRETTFVRVYDGEVSGQFGGWLMNLDDIKGLTPEEIRDVYALPAIPKYMTDVTLESGTTLRTGIVNPLEGWGKGGARQFDLMGQRTGKFTNERLIQW
ncbi:pre-toxin TG domain-containing protein [Streptococcus oralis]|uniref:pre-toxin TG domain-containing protein n=1 Tax=Streptococcus oralis TaxID=1303 RepID=UPI001EFDD9B6|nr:pre-toxin TG domain-containing protein [Streptococcus oralis]